MIEKIVYDFLVEEMKPLPVFLEVPAEPPTEYISIERTSGGETDKIKRCTIAIQSVSNTLYNAATLNENVKTAMEALTDETNVYGCHLNSDYNYTDLTKKVHRYQAVFNLTY